MVAPEWQYRVIQEAGELLVKIDKLKHFIGNQSRDQVDPKSRSLLIQQLVAMVEYHEILLKRIGSF